MNWEEELWDNQLWATKANLETIWKVSIFHGGWQQFPLNPVLFGYNYTLLVQLQFWHNYNFGTITITMTQNFSVAYIKSSNILKVSMWQSGPGSWMPSRKGSKVKMLIGNWFHEQVRQWTPVSP